MLDDQKKKEKWEYQIYNSTEKLTRTLKFLTNINRSLSFQIGWNIYVSYRRPRFTPSCSVNDDDDAFVQNTRRRDKSQIFHSKRLEHNKFLHPNLTVAPCILLSSERKISNRWTHSNARCSFSHCCPNEICTKATINFTEKLLGISTPHRNSTTSRYIIKLRLILNESSFILTLTVCYIFHNLPHYQNMSNVRVARDSRLAPHDDFYSDPCCNIHYTNMEDALSLRIKTSCL